MAVDLRVHRIATLADFPPGSQRVMRIGRRQIGVFNLDGKLYALPNLCPHQLGPLCQGRVSGTLTARPENDWKREWVMDGEIVTCPWHGMEYHIPTGQSLAFREIRLRTYEVWVEDGWILIRL